MKDKQVKTIEPIKDRAVITNLKEFYRKDNYKAFMLFVVGLNTGLRISDIIKLTVDDANNGAKRGFLTMREKKTGKTRSMLINTRLRGYLDAYISKNRLKDSDYLFGSRKGNHIGRVQAHRLLSKGADELGVENFGTHSLRKTWGYHSYKHSESNLSLICEALNHSSEKTTLRYIGITQEMINDLYKNVQF